MSLPTPSRAQIALALIVLKSKPSDVSLEDYIRHVRSVVIDRARRVSVDAQHYIDGTLFWKQAYERSEFENNKLHDKIYELERTIQRSRDSLSASPPIENKGPKVNGAAKANTQNKRQKLDAKSTTNISYDFTPPHSTTIPPACRLLMRTIFIMQTNLKDNEVTTTSLSSSIRAACSSATKSLKDTYKVKQTVGTETSMFPIDQLCQVLVKLWSSVLEAARKCCEIDTEGPHEHITEMVHLFSRMLGQIQQSCLDKADQQVKSQKKQRSKGSAASSTSIRANEATKMHEKYCQATAIAFCQMLEAFDLNLSSHHAVFEGALCALLDHIGSSMSLLIFAEPGIKMQKQAGVSPPRGLLDVAHIDSETAILTSQLAAPYLVLIMQKVTMIADKMGDRELATLLGLRATNTTQHDNLVSKFRERLQNTLLRGVYGDEDTTFTHALSRVDGPEETNLEKLLESLSINNDRSEWFIGQVWEHLGWDILCADQA